MAQTSKGMNTPLKPLKWYRKLATTKGRIEAGAFLVEGERAIRQLVSSQPGEIIEIITIEELPSAYHNYHIGTVTESQFRSICFTKTPQGTIAVVRLPLEIYCDQLPQDAGNRVLLLEDIQDPGNVGTLIRTAAAFDFTGIVLTEKCADILSPKCIQSTAGTVLSVWLRRTSRYLVLVEELKENGFHLVAADLNGMEDISNLQHQNKLLLALGNESSGLSNSILDASDYRLKIPIARGKAESLNVAVCGAICMYLSSPKY